MKKEDNDEDNFGSKENSNKKQKLFSIDNKVN